MIVRLLFISTKQVIDTTQLNLRSRFFFKNRPWGNISLFIRSQELLLLWVNAVLFYRPSTKLGTRLAHPHVMSQ